MSNYSSYATHRKMANYETDSYVPVKPLRESNVLPLYPSQPLEDSQLSKLPFMSWPAYLFEKAVSSWLNYVTPPSWMEELYRNNANSYPNVENRETDKAYIYRMALPGVALDQVALSYHNGSIMLKINASKHQKKKGNHYSYYRSLERSFSLPVRTDLDATSAMFKNGILTITIPKADKPVSFEMRTIPIHS